MISNTIVSVNRLQNGSDKFAYSKYAEALAAHCLAKNKQWIVESFSFGNDPTHDVIISGKKIEVKYQSTSYLSIEYARPDFTPSGISLSESEYYMMINPGKSKVKGTIDTYKQVGKMRLIKTNDLLKAMYAQIEAGNTIVHPAGPKGPGSRVVKINPKTINHDWLGDIECVFDEDGCLFNYGTVDPRLFYASHTRIMRELSAV
jgi:hypothetical protein